jgi:hypothetical protein
MGADVWAITSYFNPTGSQRRLANYLAFRASLVAPLLTVEWAPNGRFELDTGDADILVQLGGGDVMWQKERLLNLGVARLPPSCRHLAWLDCDILFENSEWARQALRRLDDTSLVHLYDRVAYLAAQPIDGVAGVGDWRDLPVEFVRVGYAAAICDSRDGARPVAADDLETFRRMPSNGFAWAARRELLTRNPLLDVWICGGGDSAYVLSATGRVEWVVAQHRLTRAHAEHLLPRAAALEAEVSRRVGFMPGMIAHLWHGEFRYRRHRARHEILASHGYDPVSFLRVADSGVWSWGSVPPSLPLAVTDYFRGRKEDIVEAPIEPALSGKSPRQLRVPRPGPVDARRAGVIGQ